MGYFSASHFLCQAGSVVNSQRSSLTCTSRSQYVLGGGEPDRGWLQSARSDRTETKEYSSCLDNAAPKRQGLLSKILSARLEIRPNELLIKDSTSASPKRFLAFFLVVHQS